VHGGLRYLAAGQAGVAWASMTERRVLLERVAPHLVRPLPMLLPARGRRGVLTGAGLVTADLMSRAAGTRRATLPRPRRVGAAEAARLAPALRRAGLRGGWVSWDGQLVDDVRLVVAIARTAAGLGARVLTRCRALELTGDGARLRDELTGRPIVVRARAVVNAAGVWAGGLVDGVELRPSRGTHLVLPAAALGHPAAALTVPVGDSLSRYVFALPQPDGLVYVGITDEPVRGPVPDVPQPTEPEVAMLLEVLNGVLAAPVRRTDVLGAFAGLRPLLAAGEAAGADLARRHAVLTAANGVTTVVGGKLTTYRAMAEDAVDAALAAAGLDAPPSRTRTLPLVGAGPVPAGVPVRLVERYGAEASAVADCDPQLLTPIAPGVPTTRAELRWAVRHEGALDVDDLLERRTRIGLVPAHRALAEGPPAPRWRAEPAGGAAGLPSVSCRRPKCAERPLDDAAAGPASRGGARNLGAEGGPVRVQAGLHPRHLPLGEHDHRDVVDEVHVVHEQVAVRPVVAGDVGELRLAEVEPGLVGGVVDEVGAVAAVAVVSPDVQQVEPVPDLVGGHPAQVERRRRGADRAERDVGDHDAVGLRRPAGHLRVPEQALDQRRHPQVEVAVGGPGVGATGGRGLDGVVVGEERHPRRGARDAVGGVAGGVGGGQRELDPGVADQRRERLRDPVDVGVGGSVVGGQRDDLGPHLLGGDVLLRGVVHDVHDHRDAGDAGAARGATAGRGPGRVLAALPGLPVSGDGAQQALVDDRGGTPADARHRAVSHGCHAMCRPPQAPRRTIPIATPDGTPGEEDQRVRSTT
jgi:glycerol-3-phosphate dehydrogenase